MDMKVIEAVFISSLNVTTTSAKTEISIEPSDGDWVELFAAAGCDGGEGRRCAGAVFAGGPAGAVDGTKSRAGDGGERRRGSAGVAAGAGEPGGE